jgi:hypothetical protein
MAQRSIQQLSPDEVRRAYPIAGRVDGWFFRVDEKSPGAWLVEGADLWGRKVSRTGGDPDALLEACVGDARAIVAQVQAHKPVG